MKPQDEKFTFKYNGDLEYIDFDTLYLSQLHFTQFIQELKDSFYPEGDLKIKVKALPPSSFPIELFLDLKENAETIALWGAGTIVSIGGLFGAINSIIDFYKNLDGEKPQKEIVKGNNTTVIVLENREIEINSSIYEVLKSNPKIRSELSSTFDPINKDNEVLGVELIDDKGQTKSTLSKNEFRSFKSEKLESIIEETEETFKKLLKKSVNIKIFKVVFERGFKWQFIYLGNRISAHIIDEDFIKSVSKGQQSFTNGDTINVDLRIDQRYNEFADAFENMSYTVVKVNDYIPRAKQSRLDLD